MQKKLSFPKRPYGSSILSWEHVQSPHSDMEVKWSPVLCLCLENHTHHRLIICVPLCLYSLK